MRLLTLAPWRRGPALLLRRPGVAGALFAAALVATLPAAAAPSFLSSAQHATLHRQIDRTCPGLVGTHVTGMVSPVRQDHLAGQVGPDAVVGAERLRRREQALATHAPVGLSAPLSTGFTDVDAARTGDRPLPNPDAAGLLLLGRDGFEDHVDVRAGPSGPGVWLSDEYAAAQGVRVGDELVLSRRGTDAGAWRPPGGDDRPGDGAGAGTVTLPVAAIYRDLRDAPDTPYWCGVAEQYRGDEDPHANDPPLPAALVDMDTFLSVGETIGAVAGQVVEQRLTDPRLSTSAAADLAAGIADRRATLLATYPELFASGFLDETRFESRLDRFQQRAALVRAGLLPPVLPITAAGTLVGLAVTGAAGYFWVQRRRRELTVLAAHGVGPGGLAAKAVVEALPALLAGAAGGWGAAWALVGTVGPAPVLAPGTPLLAAAAAAGTGVAALLVIATVAAARARTLADTPPATRHRARWHRLPWELVLLAAAPASWWLLDGDQVADAAAGGVGTVAHIPARLLVTPILLIVAVSCLAARGGAWLLRRHGRPRRPRSPARLLAWRRTARAAAATAVLAAATAVPAGMAAFGATATDTVHTTAEAKLRFNLGSDTVVSYPRPVDRDRDGLPPPPPVPPAIAERTAEVLRMNQQRLGGLVVDVLAVDPDTYPAGAFWDSRIPGPDLAHVADLLRRDGSVTVVASRRIAEGAATLELRDDTVPVEVADTRPLPGAQSAYPLVVVDRDRLESALSDSTMALFTPQLWVSGPPDETLAAATDAELPLAYTSTIDEHRAGAVYEPVTYTFQYLTALSMFTGLISAIGLLLYLEARTAAYRRGYVLLRRMGLRPGQHRRAVLLEIAAPVTVGLGLGGAAAMTVAYLLRHGFDVDPGRFPGALVAPPTATAGVVAAAALLIAATAALVTHYRVHHCDPAEVLRDTP